MFSISSLQFQIIDERVLASFHLVDYKFIAISVFEKVMPVEFRYVRSLADPHNTDFSENCCFVGAYRKFKSRFSFFLEIFYSEDNSSNSYS